MLSLNRPGNRTSARRPATGSSQTANRTASSMREGMEERTDRDLDWQCMGANPPQGTEFVNGESRLWTTGQSRRGGASAANRTRQSPAVRGTARLGPWRAKTRSVWSAWSLLPLGAVSTVRRLRQSAGKPDAVQTLRAVRSGLEVVQRLGVAALEQQGVDLGRSWGRIHGRMGIEQ